MPKINASPHSQRGDPRHECDNCGETWNEGDLQPIKHYFQRVEPGGIVPSGECPECGCLCYPVITSEYGG
jgi:hypothetical protein